MVAKKTQQISVLMNPRCFLRAIDLVVSSQLENILRFLSLLGTSYSHHNDTAVSVMCHTLFSRRQGAASSSYLSGMNDI